MSTCTARKVVSELLTQGVLEIRSLARSGVSDSAEADRLGEIYMIADICHGFASSLGRGMFGRERRSRHALSWRWEAIDEAGRDWIRSRLEDLGPDYVRVLEECVGR